MASNSPVSKDGAGQGQEGRLAGPLAVGLWEMPILGPYPPCRCGRDLLSRAVTTKDHSCGPRVFVPTRLQSQPQGVLSHGGAGMHRMDAVLHGDRADPVRLQG